MAEHQPNFYAFRYPAGQDVHEIKLTLNVDDHRRWLEDDGWYRVTDQATGRRWNIRRYPCGAPCRCAAQAREVRSYG